MVKQQHYYIEELHAGTLFQCFTVYLGLHGSVFLNGRIKKSMY